MKRTRKDIKLEIRRLTARYNKLDKTHSAWILKGRLAGEGAPMDVINEKGEIDRKCGRLHQLLNRTSK